MTALIAVAIVLLGLADVVTTALVLDRGGKEANPLMRWLMDKLGNGWMVVKLALHIFVAALVWEIPAFLYGGFVFVALYALIVGNNFRVLKKMESKT